MRERRCRRLQRLLRHPRPQSRVRLAEYMAGEVTLRGEKFIQRSQLVQSELRSGRRGALGRGPFERPRSHELGGNGVGDVLPAPLNLGYEWRDHLVQDGLDLARQHRTARVVLESVQGYESEKEEEESKLPM